MGKARKQTRSRTSQKGTPIDPRHQPSKAELEADVSLPVTPERLMRAVVAGGAKRRER